MLSMVLILSACAGKKTKAVRIPPPSPQSLTSGPFFAETEHPHSNLRRIALLLPLEGSQKDLGKAVQEGFLSAFYHAGRGDFTIRMYNTNGTSAGIPAAYQQALAEQADILIGPLTKPELKALMALKPEIPVLALNTLPGQKNIPSHLYQFGLLPEDEIATLVDLAWHQSHRRVVILASANDWGKRLAKHFQLAWEQRGGKVLQILEVPKMADRQVKVEQWGQAWLAQPENAPDMFFLATPTDIARQLKPLLEFHYQHNVPIFASASIYSGVPNPLKDQELNGLEFCDMPWLLDNSEAVRRPRYHAEKLYAQSFQRSPRLFAMGIDAFNIVEHWQAFTEGQGALPGMTGTLELGPEHQVRRQLFCSRFVEGKPKAIKTVKGY